MDIDTVADELYALTPEDFTAARNARAKEAKAAGEKELAAAILGLGKPTMVGWLANQLVRERRDELEPLMELGAGLREASASLSGAELRDLGRQQHRLVHALVQQAKQIAVASGRRVSADTERGLDDSLHAALADEAAAEELLAGHLTGTLQRVGFPAGADGGVPDARPDLRLVPKPSASKAPSSDAKAKAAEKAERRAAERADAERAEADARTMAEEAAESLRGAEDDHADAEKAVSTAADKATRLRTELTAAEETQSAAERDRRTARAALERAQRQARDADGKLRLARTRLDRLS